MSLMGYRGDPGWKSDYYRLQGEFVYLDEVQKIYFEKKGNGPSVLIIPGHTGDANEHVLLFNSLIDKFTVVTYDRRGFSRSPSSWQKTTIEELANDAASLIKRLNLGSVTLISSGVGASIATKVMARNPNLVERAFLHEPWVPNLLPDPQLLMQSIREGQIKVQEKQYSLNRNCGDYEGKLRHLYGKETYEVLSVFTRRRIYRNYDAYSIEESFFSKWEPVSLIDYPAFQTPLKVTIGKNTSPLIREMAMSACNHFRVRPIEIEGGHGAFIDSPDSIRRMLLK